MVERMEVVQQGQSQSYLDPQLAQAKSDLDLGSDSELDFVEAVGELLAGMEHEYPVVD